WQTKATSPCTAKRCKPYAFLPSNPLSRQRWQHDYLQLQTRRKRTPRKEISYIPFQIDRRGEIQPEGKIPFPDHGRRAVSRSGSCPRHGDDRTLKSER